MNPVLQAGLDTFAPTALPTTGFGLLTGALLVALIIVGIVAYIYGSLVMWTLGGKLKVEPRWLAWVPLINGMFYLPMLAGYKWYYGWLWLLAFIPIVGSIVSIALTIWWWWKISEARKRDGWLGILMIIPLANIIIMGYLAWSDK